jgi:hypothetical protein
MNRMSYTFKQFLEAKSDAHLSAEDMRVISDEVRKLTGNDSNFRFKQQVNQSGDGERYETALEFSADALAPEAVIKKIIPQAVKKVPHLYFAAYNDYITDNPNHGNRWHRVHVAKFRIAHAAHTHGMKSS